MSEKEYFRVSVSGPKYVTFEYIESDEYIYMGMESICDELNSQRKQIEALKGQLDTIRDGCKEIYDDKKRLEKNWKN